MPGKRLSDTAHLAPGTLVHVGPERTEGVRLQLLRYGPDSHQVQDGPALEELPALAASAGQGVLWLRVEGLSPVQTIASIGQAFGLHPLAQEDLVNTSERPKLTDYGDYLFLGSRCLLPQAQGWRSESVTLVLGRGWVLSFQESHAPVLEPVAKRLISPQSRLRQRGADFLAYALLDAVVDTYFTVLEAMEDQSEEVQEDLLRSPQRALLLRLHQLKRDSLLLRKVVWPLREVVGSLSRSDSSLLTGNIGIYLRDVYDHTVQILDTAENLRDLLAGMLDIYLSSVSNRLNEVMKVLTVIATIFMPLSFIAGWYGMNFKYMPELEQPWGYPAALGLALAVAGGMLYYFRRKGWF